MNPPPAKQGMSTPVLLLLIGGGLFGGMFVLCCGGCLMMPMVGAISESATVAKMTPEERIEHKQQQADELLAAQIKFELDRLSVKAHKEVRGMMKFPSTARFEHPNGGGFGMPSHEQVDYGDGIYAIRGNVFAKNALGVEGAHEYECLFVVQDGDFKTARLDSVELDGELVRFNQ
jgi:hypothetical protein